MNKNNRLWRTVVSACLSTLMAGASVCALMGAMQLPFGTATAYLTALAVSALCGLATVSGVMAAVSAMGFAALLGGVCMAHSGGFAQLAQVWQVLTDPMGRSAMAGLTQAGALLAPLISAVLAAVMFAMVHNPGGTPFALLIELAVLIGSYALCPSLPLSGAVPGLIAGVCAFALSGEGSRDAEIWRTLVPAVIAVCAAVLLVPPQGTVWEPMQQAADRVRSAFEDYFRFTQERIPFTISTEGYDYAAEVDGSVVTLLGGPATPDPEEVLRVAADGSVLLRGSIRREYTGHAWVDNAPKARYLFYDFTRRRVRESVFDMEENKLFVPVQATVSVLTEGTSTVFVPGRLEEFSMGPDTAVYYNSVGEMFLARNVRQGDMYSMIGYRTPDAQTLRIAVEEAH